MQYISTQGLSGVRWLFQQQKLVIEDAAMVARSKQRRSL
jgi:hypothetical protein